MKSWSLTILLALLTICNVSKASHIVGGEFELRYLGDYYFEVRLIQYFDELNGNPQAKDPSLVAYVYDKKTDSFVQSITLQLIEEEVVLYSVPECADENLVTTRLAYLNTAYFDPDVYNDPEGYYLVWERCCRNYVITNIQSAQTTGQTFYLEFPPVVVNGEEYVNNTPQIFPPLSDYGCIGRYYYADFSGTDPDGDSLVYSLSVPLNSSEFSPVPVPTPAPHPPVLWTEGSSDSIPIPGLQPLAISNSGLLTITPSMEGLFVFAIKVEEYRNGKKIGEVRRDFQLLVIDCPDQGSLQDIKVNPPDSDEFFDAEQIVNIGFDEDKCFNFIVTDEDAYEKYEFSAIAVNFDADLDQYFSEIDGELNPENDTIRFAFCLPECPLVENRRFIIDILVRDRTCPQPQIDTVRLNLFQESPPNLDPEFSSPTEDFTYVKKREGENYSVIIAAEDADLDDLKFEIEGIGNDISTFGFSLDTLKNEAGEVEFRLNWYTGCEVYPFGLQNVFPIFLTVDDQTKCPTFNKDTLSFLMEVELPDNEGPVITINNNPNDRFVVLEVGEELRVEVKSNDANPEDTISLSASGIGYFLPQVGMVFNDTTGQEEVASDLTWELDCSSELVFIKDTFEVLFVSDDRDICQIQDGDSLILTVKLQVPDNRPPTITYEGYEVSDSIFLLAGEEVELMILASDPEGDTLSVSLANRTDLGGRNISFTDSTALSQLNLPFSFTTLCSDLAEGFQAATYKISFLADDKGCYADGSDTTNLFVVVNDKEIDNEFNLPNVFTPDNFDNKNDYFYIKPIPEENCESNFLAVEVYNRWGRKVYENYSKDFRWDGGGHEEGVYYYVVKFTDRTEKGMISILR